MDKPDYIKVYLRVLARMLFDWHLHTLLVQRMTVLKGVFVPL